MNAYKFIFVVSMLLTMGCGIAENNEQNNNDKHSLLENLKAKKQFLEEAQSSLKILPMLKHVTITLDSIKVMEEIKKMVDIPMGTPEGRRLEESLYASFLGDEVINLALTDSQENFEKKLASMIPSREEAKKLISDLRAKVNDSFMVIESFSDVYYDCADIHGHEFCNNAFMSDYFSFYLQSRIINNFEKIVHERINGLDAQIKEIEQQINS